MLRLSSKINRTKKGDNRGLSIVELIIVIAIMSVLLGLLGLSINMLVGAEAKQAVKKMDAQLNDVKTGAMTRASEYMVVRYIDVDAANKATQKAMAEQGVDKSGFYAEKHISTITNGDAGSPAPTDPAVAGSVKVDYGGVEYTRIGSKKVEIKVEGNEITAADVGGGTGYKLEYDRKTGRILTSKLVSISGTGLTATYTDGSDVALTNMTFKAGLRTYQIDFSASTGKHTIAK
ncbi:MAG: prepilin-type N-terminal cleavage/methylation domain-containing protein [Lachnospiraceae bacterium]|nr:prepilin-type N-terminal cleavage/methylation domain-containing protein [Lachnospiraceae bacterium]